MSILKQKISNTAVDLSISANYEDAQVVHRTGNESVAGTKTFTESPLVPTVADVDDASMKSATTKFVQDVVFEKGGRVSSEAGNALERKDDGLAVIVSPDSDNVLERKDDGLAVIVSSDDDNRLEKTSSGLKVVTRIVTVTGDSGTLFEAELEMLKADKRAMIERDSVIYQYASTLSDGKMRYTVVNSFLGGIDYLCTILVDITTGEWEYEYDRVYMCKFSNVPPTTVTNPSGVSGPFFYSIVNDLLHLQWDGVSVASAGAIYIWDKFPSAYLPKQSKQQCTCGVDFANGYSNCFLYINPTGVRMKAWTANKAYWGSLTLHLDF